MVKSQVKTIALLRKRADLTREQFIAYYETSHAPLIRRLLPMIADYRRNYVNLDGAYLFPDAAPIDFDVMTEISFASETDYAAFRERAAEPDVAQAIAEDEENVFDRGATRLFRVDQPS